MNSDSIKPIILIVLGTRPEIIKLFPLIQILRSKSPYKCEILYTGQHQELADQAFSDVGIRPDHSLTIPRKHNNGDTIVTFLTDSIIAFALDISPQLIIVQGDTYSSYAGTLAGFGAHIPVAHVEAGMRTYDMLQPFPEEMHRQAIGQMATLHFAPSQIEYDNLINEGIPANRVTITGNTGIDALRVISKDLGIIDQKEYILVTCHRRENRGVNFDNICEALIKLSESGHHIKYCLHPNPAFIEKAKQKLANQDRIELIPPQGYKAFVQHMKASRLILTDSGGIQEEAAYMGLPFLVLRNATERTAISSIDNDIVIGTDPKHIINAIGIQLQKKNQRPPLLAYGDGHSSKLILKAIQNYLG